jgi:hypothetical protein
MAKVVGTIDRVVIVTEEDDLCKIIEVDEEHSGNLYCEEHILPLNDASLVKISEKGRVFFYNCSLPYINEIQHLAQVEQNLVINKALIFKGEENDKNGPGMFTYLLVVLAFIALVVAIAN